MGRTLLIIVVLAALAVGGYLAKQGGEKAAPVVGAPIQQISRAQDQALQQNLLGAQVALEQARSTNGTYEGADVSAFGALLAATTETSYCVQVSEGTAVYRLRGPGGSVEPGAC